MTRKRNLNVMFLSDKTTERERGQDPPLITHNPLQPRLSAKSPRTTDHGSSGKGQGERVMLQHRDVSITASRPRLFFFLASHTPSVCLWSSDRSLTQMTAPSGFSPSQRGSGRISACDPPPRPFIKSTVASASARRGN